MKLFFSLLLPFFILFIGCQQEDIVVADQNEQEITAARQFYEQNVVCESIGNSSPRRSSLSRHALGKSMDWDQAWTKSMSYGIGIVIPLAFEKDLYGFCSGTFYDVSEWTYAMMYKTPTGAYATELITSVPTTDTTDSFTGILLVEDWQGNLLHQYTYLDGEIFEGNTSSGSREMDICVTVDYYTCVEWEGGSSCHISSSETTCTTAGGTGSFGGGGNYDPGDGNHAGGGSGGSVDEVPVDKGPALAQNPFKLCANTLSFVLTADGFTANIGGLGADLIQDYSGKIVSVSLGLTCVAMNPYHLANRYDAAEAFASIYNSARDELAIWAREPEQRRLLSSFEVESKLKQLLNSEMNAFYGGSLSYKTGCSGNIPVSVAGYDFDC